MTNQEIANGINGYINPFWPNLITNAPVEIQKEFVNVIGDKFKGSFLRDTHDFYVLHFNGTELMRNLDSIMMSMEQWCLKNGINYDIEREYRKLQQATMNDLSKEELKNLYDLLWKLEEKRNKQTANRYLSTYIFESYLACKIYDKILSSNPEIKNIKSNYFFDEKEDILGKVVTYIESGDIEGYRSVKQVLTLLNDVTNLCGEQYKKYNNGYFILISNGENLFDYDFHNVINGIIANRSASMSMNIMTRLGGLYKHSTSGGHSIQLTHDYNLIDVEYVKKR